jgi:GxxExxY protein
LCYAGSFFFRKWVSGGYLSAGISIRVYKGGVKLCRELEMPIYYKDYLEPIGFRRVDFLVEDKVLVELKALGQLEDVHLVQILNYIKAYKLEIGLLINFGEKSLNFKRLIL